MKNNASFIQQPNITINSFGRYSQVFFITTTCLIMNAETLFPKWSLYTGLTAPKISPTLDIIPIAKKGFSLNINITKKNLQNSKDSLVFCVITTYAVALGSKETFLKTWNSFETTVVASLFSSTTRSEYTKGGLLPFQSPKTYRNTKLQLPTISMRPFPEHPLLVVSV